MKLQARQSPRGRPCNCSRLKVRTQPLPRGGRLWSGRLWLKPRSQPPSPSPSPRGRLCNCKRKCRAARMADPAAHRSVFLLTSDWNDGSLIYGVRLVLATRSSSAAGSESDDPAQTLEIRPSADPVLRWSEEEVEYSTFAAVSGDTILALIADSRKTMVHDMATRVDIPGPRLRCSKRRPAMLPVGDATVLVMDTSLRPRSSCFEAFRRVPGGGWRADPLPNPPVADQDRHGRFPYPCVSAYFARGSRAWISVSMAGTFSLDTERGTWRMEGTWELPLCDRGLFVPELGLVFGIASRGIKPTDPQERCCQVCALDVEAGRPPVVRHVWEIPPERVQDVAPWGGLSLAYLGNGRFCVSRSVIVRGGSSSSSEDRGTSFALLDVTRLPDGDLQLAEHGKLHCHVWPWSHSGHAIFLQPA